MSFSKARLRRFNEGVSQVPSPGRYDPKLDNNVKGAVLPTSKRFPGQTISSSLDNIEKASTVSSEVVFRTPQVMRKVPLTPRLQYLKEKNFDTSGSDILSSEERPVVKSALKRTMTKADYKRLEDELHLLEDEHQKMLLDKEMEINILKEEIEEIKIHETELKDILEEKSKLATDRHKEALQLKDNLETMVQKIKVDREEHQKFIESLKLEILELQNKKYELETVLAEKQSVIVTINDKYSDLENEFKSLQEENLQLEKANTCVVMGAGEKIELLDKKINEKLKALPETYDMKYEEEQIAFQTKVNYMVHEFNMKSRELIDKVKQSQDKVKELERLVDKKVKEFSKNITEADERCKYLYRELCKVEEQREELVVSDLEKKLAIIEIQEKSDSYKSELDQCRNTCRKYQVTLNTMNETITALSNRLLESEQEVERLNKVEKDLKLQTQFLEEKSQLLLNDISSLRGSMDKMEEEIIQDVSSLKEYLEAKADLFKEEALKTEHALNKKIYEKQSAIDILLKENEYFKKEIERKDELIEDIKERESKFEESIEKLKSEHSKLEEELSEKLSAQKNLYNILSDKLKSTKSLVSNLQHVKVQHESQIISLEEELKEYKSALPSLEKVNLEQSKLIQSLQSELEIKREKDSETRLVLESKLSDLQLQLSATKEKLIMTENDKFRLEKLDSEKQIELEHKISNLQSQLTSAKEKIKTEIPKLEQDNIHMAENILELNLNIDSLKEEMDLLKTNISCLQAEKDSLNNVLEESKSKISDLEKTVENKNLAISVLNAEKNRINKRYDDLVSQLELMSTAYEKQNEVMKDRVDESVARIEAEQKLLDLESQLLEKDEEIKQLTQRINDSPQLEEVIQLREKLEVLQIKYDSVLEDRDKLTQEVGELMGHQNINQKIKHVSELKLQLTKLIDENDLLRVENLKFRTKLESIKKQSENNKENMSVQRKEERGKTSRPSSAKKKPMSPSVLKPSNH